jgi:hypothetical protein
MATPKIYAKVDDAEFQKNFAIYLRETSKSMEDAINFKLYDGAREAFKTTHKADKGTIKAKLDETASKYPKRTVAEMLVITQMQADGIEEFDLDAEVKKLKHNRTNHIGFIRAGWLPAIRDLLGKIGKNFANFSGVKRSAYGGAHPAKTTHNTITGEIFNDTQGKGSNGSFVQRIKEVGGENAKNKINSDIVTYLTKKMGIPIDKFNRS